MTFMERGQAEWSQSISIKTYTNGIMNTCLLEFALHCIHLYSQNIHQENTTIAECYTVYEVVSLFYWLVIKCSEQRREKEIMSNSDCNFNLFCFFFQDRVQGAKTIALFYILLYVTGNTIATFYILLNASTKTVAILYILLYATGKLSNQGGGCMSRATPNGRQRW